MTTLASAVLADEYVLTHKSPFIVSEKPCVSSVQQPHMTKASGSKENRQCFYSHKPGHVIADCLALKRETQLNSQQTKGVGFVQAVSRSEVLGCGAKMPDPCFEPFISDGLVPLTANRTDVKPIPILRETRGSQTVIFSGVLPFSTESTCGFNSALLPGQFTGFT